MKGFKFVVRLALSVMLLSGFGMIVQTQAATAHASSYSKSVSAMKAKYTKQIKEYRSILSSNTSSINGIKRELIGYKELGKTKYDSTLSSLEAKAVKQGKTNAALSSKVSKFEKDVKAQKNTKKDATLGKTSSSLKKQLVALKTEIGKTKSEVASIGKKKKAEVELNMAKLFLTNETDRLFDGYDYVKTTIQKMRNRINELLTTTPSKYDAELKKIDSNLVSLNKSNEDVKKQVLSLQKKIENLPSPSSIAKLYHNDVQIIGTKLEDLSNRLIEYWGENLDEVADKVIEIGRERKFDHYMKHYDEMNMLKEKLQLDSTADENDADDLRKLLHEKGVSFGELDRVAWSYFYKLQDYRTKNYKVVEEAYDRLQKLSTQEDDKSFATQLTLVNGLIDTFINNRKVYAQKEKEAILEKCSGTTAP
ncbi:hypothetical protein ACQKP0_08890 [Heyndrickxia sp. NPDC080065]|uniref:hypothetical protein n=1 Tax=Heyndrickxia sp. NPDC080065 TaxID=3390568 RepID=UPI003CFBE062